MEAYNRGLKSEGHMPPLLVAITHLNDLFMQNNLVAMVTVKHVSMCAEIFSDTWDWKKSQTAPHWAAAINANVRIFILWSVGAVATLLLLLSRSSVLLGLFLDRVETAVCASLPVHSSSQFIHSCTLLLNRTRFYLGTELCGDAFITFNLQDHNKMWNKRILTFFQNCLTQTDVETHF